MQNSFHTRAPWWLAPLCALIVLFLVAPTLVVIPMSFSDSRFLTFPPASWSLRWYLEYFQSLEWREATWVSLRAAVGTTALATPLGLAAAYAAARVTAGHARWLRLVFLLPLALPVILCGVGVFLLYARLGLNNTLLGLVLAHTCLALPLVFITVSAALASFDFSQEMAARSLGGASAAGVPRRDAAADPLLGDGRGHPGLHHLAGRSGGGAIHRRRPERHAHQAHVQFPAR